MSTNTTTHQQQLTIDDASLACFGATGSLPPSVAYDSHDQWPMIYARRAHITSVFGDTGGERWRLLPNCCNACRFAQLEAYATLPQDVVTSVLYGKYAEPYTSNWGRPPAAAGAVELGDEEEFLKQIGVALPEGDRSPLNDIFSFELYNHYGWPPGRTVTDSVGNDLTLSETTKESLHKRRLTASTVTWDPVAFSHWTYNTVNSYKTLNILAPMGNDFEWQNAEPDFVGLDELISFFEDHSEYGINLFYSTPATVGNTLLSASESLSLKTDDFFPYSDTFNDYWTGYFTSHPAFKRYVRTSSALFHSARQIHTLASSDVKLLDSLDAPWHAISVTQHHDAITGTSKSFVYDDYLSQLDDGNNASAAVILSSLSALDSSIPSSWELCPPIKEDPSYCSELGAGRMVMVLNSIGSSQDIPINLQVSSDALCVFDSDGTETTSQIREAPWVSGLNLFELSFMAEDMPSLGARTYSLESCSKAEKITNKVSSPQATVSIENNFYKLSFDTATNTLSSILEKTNGNTVSINIDVLYYVPEGSPLIPRDGAYVFNTRKSPLSFPGPRGALTTFYGDVYQEVEIIVDQASNVIQRFRLNKNDPFIEMYTTVGPISTTDKNGKEVIVKIQSPISSAGFLYTDTHNLEFQKREYNVLYGKYIMDNDISGNYYPISSAAYIQDDNLMLAILPDRAQGAASLTNGSLEVMIHRRLLEDGDHKGVGEPLDDSTAICTKQLLILSSTDSGISTLRSAALRHEHSPAVLSSISGTTPAPFSWSPMSVSLPANVHLTTLQVTRYDIFGASTLVRLHHNFAVDEDPVLSQPATVDLSSLFADWTVTSAVEVSLSAAHKVQSLSSMTITLNPMEFKTFAVSLTKKQ
ncbi:lysosomal alpha-mannosidase [Pelomyxa schiedti]|nr:lysosomal alpha-mannosidase [Pelomyxa schiedti]